MESKTLSINFLALERKLAHLRDSLEYGLSPKNRFYSLVDLQIQLTHIRAQLEKVINL